MPYKNGTGPEGKGPKTGRGLGPCGDGTPRGGGRGRGFGGAIGSRNVTVNDKKPEIKESKEN